MVSDTLLSFQAVYPNRKAGESIPTESIFNENFCSFQGVYVKQKSNSNEVDKPLEKEISNLETIISGIY